MQMETWLDGARRCRLSLVLVPLAPMFRSFAASVPRTATVSQSARAAIIVLPLQHRWRRVVRDSRPTRAGDHSRDDR